MGRGSKVRGASKSPKMNWMGDKTNCGKDDNCKMGIKATGVKYTHTVGSGIEVDYSKYK